MTSLERSQRYMALLGRTGYYGDVTFRFRNGEVQMVDEHKTRLGKDLPTTEDELIKSLMTHAGT
jgi:hypothetical protein